MDIQRRVKVGMRFKMTDGGEKQFSPLLMDALAASVGEPLSQSAAPRAVLGRPMRVHLHRDDLVEVGFVFCLLIDLAAQLVGTPAVHAPRFAALARLDLA